MLAAVADRVRKATQLGFAFTPRQPVQKPGSRGGHGYFDAHGAWQYGDRPTADAFRRGFGAYADGAPIMIGHRVEYLDPITERTEAGTVRGLHQGMVTIAVADGTVSIDAAFPSLRRASDPPAPVERPLLLMTSPGAAPATPLSAKTYDDAPHAQPWEVLEDEYVARELTRQRARAVRQVEGWTKALAEARGAKAKRDAEAQVHWWTESAAKWAADDPKHLEVARRHAALAYLQLVRAAISKGKPVPTAVIAQSMEYRKAADARARWEKGRHTAFGNVSVAVDASMQKTRGYKVKRQDGKRITAEQKTAIATGIDEIVAALGPLTDVMEGANLTIAHTSGKHPFLSTAGGQYQPSERTITMGIRSRFGRGEIPSLAHEFGHFLDLEAGALRGVEVLVGGGAYYGRTKVRRSSSLAEQDARAYSREPPEGEVLLREATARMTDTYAARQLATSKLNAATTDDARGDIERFKVILGPYWRSPAEVLARLTEQYVATKLARAGVAMDAPDYYEHAPAYWSKAVFAELAPLVERELQRRVAILRAHANPGAAAVAKERAGRLLRVFQKGRGPRATRPCDGPRVATAYPSAAVGVPSPPTEGVAALVAQRTAIERDLFHLDDQDIPALEGRDDNDAVMAKAKLLTLRASLLNQLAAVGNALRKARASSYEEESAQIRENRLHPHARRAHRFRPATWTFPNGHPRCRLCGDEPGPNHPMCDGVDAMAKARKLHYRRTIDGLDVSVENRRGSRRHWTDHDGSTGSTKLTHAYGYARGTRSPTDGEHLDVFLGPLGKTGEVEGSTVYIITTNKPPDFVDLDEQKAMVGFPSALEARNAFLENYSHEPRFIRQIDAMPWEQFVADAKRTGRFPELLGGTVIARNRGLLLVAKAKPAARPAARPLLRMAPARRSASAPADPPRPRLEPRALAGHLVELADVLERGLAQVQQAFPGVPLAGRVKQTATLAAKVAAADPSQDLDGADDVASLRLVLEDEDAEQMAAKRLQRMLGATNVRDYVTRPLGLGARGVDCTVTIEGRPIEVQLRTARQVAWSDYAHDVTVKTGGTVPPEVAEYLRAMSEAFAAADRGEADGDAPECPEVLATMLGPLVAPNEVAA